MVKAYLRYELSQSWGVIASNANVCYDHSGSFLLTASLENVSVWNLKQGKLVSRRCRGMRGSPAACTALQLPPCRLRARALPRRSRP